jgi:hypothetical protein
MKRHWLFIAVVGLIAGGCAQEGTGRAPSFLGLSDVARADTLPPQAEQPKALRHVHSSKVLGAMAFQKVTGRTVDPERLNGAE